MELKKLTIVTKYATTETASYTLIADDIVLGVHIIRELETQLTPYIDSPRSHDLAIQWLKVLLLAPETK